MIDQTQYYTACIIDMGKVTAHPAMVKKLDGRALDNGFCKQKNSHVGSAPGPVDCKEPQARDRQLIQMAVRISHHLVGLLGRGVEADRMVGFVDDRKRHLG